MVGLLSEDGTPTNMGLALDTTSMENSGPSLSDSVGDIITKGIPVVGWSVANSYYNTAVAVGNVFGADNQYADTADWLDDPDKQEFYQNNSAAVEGLGLFAGSFGPGALGVKLLKAATSAARAATAGELSSTIADSAGMFRSARTAKLLEAAQTDVAAGDSSLLPSLLRDYTIKLSASSVADAALEGIAFNTASMAAQYGSPLLRDKDLSDLVHDFAWGTGLYAGIGGGLASVGIRGILKRAVIEQEATLAPVKELARNVGLANEPQDKLLGMIDNYLDRPGKVNVSNAGSTTEFARADNADYLAIKEQLIKMLPKGETSPNEVADALFNNVLKAPRDAGVSKEDILLNFSQQPEFSRIDMPETGVYSSEGNTQFYLTGRQLGKDFTDESGVTRPALLEDLFTNNPENALSGAGYVKAGEVKTTTAADYSTAMEAFQNGSDLHLTTKGQIVINPKAENLKAVPLPGLEKTLSPKALREWRQGVYNDGSNVPNAAGKKLGNPRAALRGSAWFNQMEPTVIRISDGSKILAKDAKPVIGDYGNVNVTRAGISAGEGKSTFNIPFKLNEDMESAYNNPGSNTLTASGRIVWANKTFANVRDFDAMSDIKPQDFPVLEAAYRAIQSEAIKKNVDFSKIVEGMDNSGITIGGEKIPPSSQGLLEKIKYAKDAVISEMLQRGLKDPAYDADRISLVAGVPNDYIQNGLKGDFLSNPAKLSQINNIKVNYNISRTSPDWAMQQGGMLDHQQRVILARNYATQQSARFFGDKLEAATAGLSARDCASWMFNATKQGLLSSASAAYGSFMQVMERIGREAYHGVVKDRIETVHEILSSAKSALDNSPESQRALMMYQAVHRRSGETFRQLPAELQAQHFPELKNGETVRVLRDSLTRQKNEVTGAMENSWNKEFLPTNEQGTSNFQQNPGAGIQPAQPKLFNYYTLPKEASDFLAGSRKLNDSRLMHENNGRAARGLPKQIETGNDYFPPINTKDYPHFAYVKFNAGSAFGDNGASVVTGRTADELNSKIAMLRDDGVQIFYKQDLAKELQLRQEFDRAKLFQDTQSNNLLKRRGILNDVIPGLNYDTFLKEHADWHISKEMGLTRDMIELNNSQLFAELKALKDQTTNAMGSVKGSLQTATLKTTIDNQYDRAMKLMLGLSPKEFYRPWQDLNEAVESFGDTAFRNVRSATARMASGQLSPEAAGKLMSSYGLGNPIGDGIEAGKRYGLAMTAPDSKYLTHGLTKLQGIMGCLVIKWDAMQQLLHAATMPILTIPEISNVLRNLGTQSKLLSEVSTTIPGTSKNIPSISKVIFGGLQDYFDSGLNAEWRPKFQRMGVIRDAKSEWMDMLNDISIPFGGKPTVWDQWGKNVDAVLSKVSMVNNVEDFTNVASGHIARRLFSAAGYTGRDLEDNIATFVNRVKTNVTSSQRPIAFQGPVGQAIGLFQSFYMNLMQSVFRYVENGDVRSMMLLGGLQSTAFGLQGLPLFQAINKHIATAPGNSQGQDMYSTIAGFAGHGGVGNRQLGDYLLYGTVSNWMNASMYTRSDISPRQVSLVPLNPVDWPLISAGTRLTENLYDVSKKISDGGSVPGSTLLGLEHNGMSRPLMGLAQLLQGFSTTGKGNLVDVNSPPQGADNTGMDDLMNGAYFSRLLGSRPMDESIFLNSNYRVTAFRAAQEARLEEVGKAVKSKLYGGGTLTSDDLANFTAQWAKLGGQLPQFQGKLINWSKDANVSMANGIFSNPQHIGNRYLITMMGGQYPQYLADYKNTPSLLTAPTVIGEAPTSE